MDRVTSYWNKHFPSMAPVSWDLRSSLPDRWVRFHSLPKGKRYPETKKDRAIVVERAHALMTALMGEEGPYYMMANVYEPDPGLPFTIKPDWTYHGIPLKEAFRGPEDAEEDASTIAVFTGVAERLDHNFEEAVLGIAEDRSARCIWVSPQVRAVFAPYDGGFDIIAPTPRTVSTLKADFKKWLSNRPDGL